MLRVPLPPFLVRPATLLLPGEHHGAKQVVRAAILRGNTCEARNCQTAGNPPMRAGLSDHLWDIGELISTFMTPYLLSTACAIEDARARTANQRVKECAQCHMMTRRNGCGLTRRTPSA